MGEVAPIQIEDDTPPTTFHYREKFPEDIVLDNSWQILNSFQEEEWPGFVRCCIAQLDGFPDAERTTFQTLLPFTTLELEAINKFGMYYDNVMTWHVVNRVADWIDDGFVTVERQERPAAAFFKAQRAFWEDGSTPETYDGYSEIIERWQVAE